MKPLRPFTDFLKEGIVKKQSPNKQRAESLVNRAKDEYYSLRENVSKSGIHEKNANSIIKDAYDIIMELIRAKMMVDGFNASGSYSHEAEVSYLRELKFLEPEVQFINQLRYFRNGISYYGEKQTPEYAKRVVDFLEKIYLKLLRLLQLERLR